MKSPFQPRLVEDVTIVATSYMVQEAHVLQLNKEHNSDLRDH